MARPRKGKPLSLRPIRLDDDVWAECQRLGKEHGTINEGLSAALAALRVREAQRRIMAETGDPWKALALPQPVVDGMLNQGHGNQDPKVPMWKQIKPPLLKPSEKKR